MEVMGDHELCGRCGTEIRTGEDREACSVCGGPLCHRCWDEYGEGRHVPADLSVRPAKPCRAG